MPSTIIDSTIFQGIFTTDEMRRVWSDENRTEKYLDIEAALAKVQAELGLIPAEAAQEIIGHCRLDQIDLPRLREQTERIGYPILGVVTQTLAEVTVLAEKSGISRQALLACLNKSVMGSTFSKYKTPAFVNLDFHPTFTSTLLRKDFDLGLAEAREREVPMPIASAVHQLVQALIGNGFGEDDFATLLVLQARSAGLELVSENAEISDGLEPASSD